MRLGTPGFIGERLREAREARGITGIALADLLSVSRQVVSQYENGAVTPGPEVLERIARTLNVPAHFFWRPIQRAQIGTVFYRSMASATKTARTRLERRYGWLKEIAYYLSEFVEFPDAEFPDASISPLKLNTKDIERIALEVRKDLGLGVGPAPNLVVLLENMGAIISRFEVETETLDAFSEWSVSDGRPFFILSADKDSAYRSRMDAAHELGHMVLHRNLSASLLANKETFDLIEAQVKRFAGAFLLPAEEFGDDFFYPTLGECRRIKEKWGVSMSSVIKRCQDLDLLPENEITRLWVALSRAGWRTREPLDDETEPEQPRVLRDAIELLLGEGIQSRAQIKGALPFSARDIEALSGLPGSFLEEPKPGVVVELKARPSSSDPSGQGRIVQFVPKKK